MLCIWDNLLPSLYLSKYFGPMIPLFNNLAFSPALRSSTFGPWNKHDHRRLFQVLHSDPSLSVAYLSSSSLLTLLQWLQRQWTLTFTWTLHPLMDINTGPATFESLLLQIDPLTHTISQLYTIIPPAACLDLPKYTQTWEKDLQLTITSVSVWPTNYRLWPRLKKKGFKFITRWHRCPPFFTTSITQPLIHAGGALCSKAPCSI